MYQNFSGTQLISGNNDAVVGTAGKPVRIFSIHIISGGSASVPALRSGSVVGGTIWIQETGTASTGKTFNYGKYGVLFPSGCFADVDANCTSLAIQYEQEA